MLGDPIEWYSLAPVRDVGLALFVAGCLYFRRVESAIRGHHLATPSDCSRSGEIGHGIGDSGGYGSRSDYRIGAHADAPYRTLRESIAAGCRRLLAELPAGSPAAERTARLGGGDRAAAEFWALKDVSFEVAAGRGRRHHRPQRGRQIDPAEDPQPHHRADLGAGRVPRAGSAACWRSAPASTRN